VAGVGLIVIAGSVGGKGNSPRKRPVAHGALSEPSVAFPQQPSHVATGVTTGDGATFTRDAAWLTEPAASTEDHEAAAGRTGSLGVPH
jgi:hypothetical protein